MSEEQRSSAAGTGPGVEVGGSTVHGRGVFATRRFPPGEVVLEIDDRRLVTEDQPLDPAAGEHEHHCDWLGDRVVLMQEPERYINHRCEPNAYVDTTPDGTRRVVAYRQIWPGEEITCDYCIDGDGDTVWRCSCGHPDCRQDHTADFFNLPDHKLAEYIPLLSPWFVQRHRQRLEEVRRDLRDRGMEVQDPSRPPDTA